MAKYIPADKLKAEIEKRLSIFEHGIAYDCWASCKKIVESLQQEQPEVDLEKELIQWHKKHFKRSGTFEEYSGFYLENSSQLSIARHFYELGLNARKEE